MKQAEPQIIKLWPDNPPGYIPHNLVEKAERTDCLRIWNVSEPELHVYLPSAEKATGLAAIICPGGGYEYLSFEKESTQMAELLNSHGIAGLVLKYRLPDPQITSSPTEAPSQDILRAMEIALEQASNWHFDSLKLGVIGFSAGGHLAGCLSTMSAHRPAFSALIYPVVTMESGVTHSGSRHRLLGNLPDDVMVKKYSLEHQVDRETPPTFLLHAGDDGHVPVENSLRYFQACRNHQVPAEMHIFPSGGHGFGLAKHDEVLNSWPDQLVKWITNLRL